MVVLAPFLHIIIADINMSLLLPTHQDGSTDVFLFPNQALNVLFSFVRVLGLPIWSQIQNGSPLA